MLVSLRWLQDLCPVAAEPAEIAERLTARGLTVDSLEGVGGEGDVVLDVDVPANRPDCLGHLGIARELSAAFGVPLRPPAAGPRPAGAAVEDGFEVVIEDAGLCGRFTAGLVRGVRVGPSPDWVRLRLEACGLRSINNVVDASNLVLLELGQPVHFYDVAALPGGRISVRAARVGERIRTLDDVDRPVPEGAAVIADGTGAIGLAGIMGGATTEICETTRDVLVEAAWFDPRAVRRAASALGLSTDASQRFERGCDPEAPPLAQALSSRLLADLAGGVPAPGGIDVHPARRPVRRVTLRRERAARVLGHDPGAAAISGALDALGIPYERVADDRWFAEAPSWRVDLEREADLIEEVARHVGYDGIPSSLPASGGLPAPGSTHPLEEPARDVLAHLGFHEAFNYAMIAPAEDDPFVEASAPGALALDNPISEPLSRLRRSILPGLLAAAGRNLRRGSDDVRLFEAGRVFLPAPGAAFPDERLHLGIAWAGPRQPRHWSAPEEPAGTVDLAGVVERVLRSLRPAGAFLRRPLTVLAGLHPGHAVAWVAGDGTTLARAGSLHPDLRAALDLDTTVLLAEIDLDAVRDLPGAAPRLTPIPKVPAVSRDLSLVLSPGVSYGDVLAALRGVPEPVPCTFEAVDRYVGEPLEPDEVAVTVRVILHPQERTLTDDVAEAFRARLIDAVGSTEGVRLRG